MTETKRRGRPSLPAKEGERNSLGLRVTAETKRRLEEAAAAAGRSQSQETELRIERSFDADQLLGASLMPLFRTLSGVVAFIEAHTGKPWQSDFRTFQMVRNAFREVIESLPSPPMTDEEQASLTAMLEADEKARKAAEEAGPEPPPPGAGRLTALLVPGRKPTETEQEYEAARAAWLERRNALEVEATEAEAAAVRTQFYKQMDERARIGQEAVKEAKKQDRGKYGAAFLSP